MAIVSLISEEEKNQQIDEAIDMELKIDLMFEELNRDALHYQKLYYSERKHIHYLDQDWKEII